MARALTFFAAVALAAAGTLAPAAYAHTSDSNLVPTTITGLGDIGRDFEYLDSDGRLTMLSDHQGSIVAVFFGFTSCPDVCPGFLAKASAARELLNGKRDDFKVVFVTVDPQRDTREVLSRYLSLFGPHIIGARVPSSDLASLTDDFAVANQIVKDANGQVAISHTVGAFLFDTNTTARVYLSASKDANEIAAEVETLLEEAQL